MKKSLLITLTLFISSCSGINHTENIIPDTSKTNNISVKYEPDEVIVKLRNNVSAEKYAKKNNLTMMYSIGLNMYLFKGKTEIEILKKDSEVQWVEKNKIIELPKIKTSEVKELKTVKKNDNLPDDPLLQAQYGYTITGVDKIWKQQKGNPSTIVAVIDSGVDGNHPEFQGQLLEGLDLTVKPAVPGGNIDNYGHGTHVAGVIGAKTNNGIGISGIAPGCKILPIRIFNDFGHSSEGIATKAILWAADNGAKVINASWGSPLPGEAEKEAIQYALKKDVFFVAAVGNSGNNDPDNVAYPAASPGVIGVSGSTDIDTWASFSTYGEQVDIAAPGKGILSTFPVSKGNGYRIMEGTSMAAPHVTGIVALVRSQFPNLDREKIADIIQKNAKDIVYSGYDVYTGHGRIDAAKSISVNN